MRALHLATPTAVFTRLAGSLRGLGPYAVIGLLLPGGSLIALCLWVTRHRAWPAMERRRILVIVAALSAMLIFPMGA